MSSNRVLSFQLRRIILDQSFRAGVGHIGSALSVADIISTLYDKVLNISSPDDIDRDRFVLSKGHAALCVYAALFEKGWITKSELDSFCSDGSQLGVHPEKGLKGIDFSTGSLGQGMTFAVGAALAARLQLSQRKIYVLVSDAECNEGAVWEAAMFAAHHHLSNLVAIVDLNGQQALGYTPNVINMNPMAERWDAFGWNTRTINGNDPVEIEETLDSLDFSGPSPHVLLARTIFGKGVSFMESQIKWHYQPMSEQEYAQALSELEEIK